jgi:hypothetical protein
MLLHRHSRIKPPQHLTWSKSTYSTKSLNPAGIRARGKLALERRGWSCSSGRFIFAVSHGLNLKNPKFEKKKLEPLRRFLRKNSQKY